MKKNKNLAPKTDSKDAKEVIVEAPKANTGDAKKKRNNKKVAKKTVTEQEPAIVEAEANDQYIASIDAPENENPEIGDVDPTYTSCEEGKKEEPKKPSLFKRMLASFRLRKTA